MFSQIQYLQMKADLEKEYKRKLEALEILFNKNSKKLADKTVNPYETSQIATHIIEYAKSQGEFTIRELVDNFPSLKYNSVWTKIKDLINDDYIIQTYKGTAKKDPSRFAAGKKLKK